MVVRPPTTLAHSSHSGSRESSPIQNATVSKKLNAVLVGLTVQGVLLASAETAFASFPDVPPGYWAAAAITAVAEEQDWMQDFDAAAFHPEDLLLRRHLARALVRAFDPTAQPDPTIAFADLPVGEPFLPYAAIASTRGWMNTPGGTFSPDAPVSTIDLDRALIRALGLGPEVRGLSTIRTADGRRFRRPKGFAVLVLARQLGLHFNHTDESRELAPTSWVRRADAAFALHRASTVEPWKIESLQRYRSVVLPTMSEERRQVVRFALSYAGHPYVYAGEWAEATTPGYCCGSQPVGGFDCSGFTWWVLRAADGAWDNTAFRPYQGWPLAERSSRLMARAARPRISFANTAPTDLMFFDTDGAGRGWSSVDHVGLSLGNGWMIHSSSGRGGVSIDRVSDGWWRGRFKWSRRIIL